MMDESVSIISTGATGTAVMPKVVSFLCDRLQRVADTNDFIARFTSPEQISVFDSLTRPTISIHSYLERIFKYANCSTCCFVVAFIYLDRFSRKQLSLPISNFNAHRLLIASILVSAKFMDDISYNNAFYAKVGGMSSTSEMNIMELDFLFGVGFELNVTAATFYSYLTNVHLQMLLESPPLYMEPSSTVNVPQHFITEDESTTHDLRQLAV